MHKVLVVISSLSHRRPGDSGPYEDALRAAGVEPVIVCPEDQAASRATFLDGAAGLLLMGGDDVNPARYGEERAPETQEPDSPRDELECTLIQRALDRDLPLLGICRGLQILNVQHGGSLVQHLDATARHRRRTPDRGMPAHPVRIVPGTRLAGIAGADLTWDVNSRHHQAVARLGAGLLVSARDPEDGTIEAVERPDKRFCIAVQWHPENQSPTDPRQAALFGAFGSAL
jgi:gamma-glutamyl-gamma-aminobutyrate hydrolase PuuD